MTLEVEHTLKIGRSYNVLMKTEVEQNLQHNYQLCKLTIYIYNTIYYI